MLETLRILKLPIILPPSPEEVEEYSRQIVYETAYKQGFRLRPIQVFAIQTYDNVHGLFAPIGVGEGKTLITLLCASRAIEHQRAERVALFVPSDVYYQLVHIDIAWARPKVPLKCRFHFLGEKSAKIRAAIAERRAPGCYIVPYSILSSPKGEELLRRIEPQLVICDEAHKIARRQSARSRRLLSYLTDANAALIALSGTITSKSISEYYHLVRSSIPDQWVFLPRTYSYVQNWSLILDSNSTGFEETSSQSLNFLIKWAEALYPQGFHSLESAEVSSARRAFNLRMRTAPGCVMSSSDVVGCSLIFDITNAGKPNAHLQSLIDQLMQDWVAPNGDEIEYGLHLYKWNFELTNGFYLDLHWPSPAVLAKRRGIGEKEAELVLERARAHHEAQQAYHKVLRTWLQHNAGRGLDTPLLVAADMARNTEANVGQELYRYWKEMKALEFEDMPKRDSRPVFVDDYKLIALGRLLESDEIKGSGCIIWVWHRALARRTFDLLHQFFGDRVVFAPAKDGDQVILNPANRDKFVVASISGHCTGKNLQHFSKNIYFQWTRSAKVAEQCIGRTHRKGQKSDEVYALIIQEEGRGTFDAMNLGATIYDAIYIHQTVSPQRLIFGSWRTLPQVFPGEFLKERGFDPHQVNTAIDQSLRERFQG